MTTATGIAESSAIALVAAAVAAAGPCPSDPAALPEWERSVQQRAFGLLRIVPSVLDRSALLASCHPVTGVIVSVREVSGRGLITTRPTMGDRQSEDFRTPWLTDPDGRAMFDQARRLVGRHCRLGKRIESTRDGQKKVGMCEWIEDLGPDPDAPKSSASSAARHLAAPPASTADASLVETDRQAALAMARQLSRENRERFIQWLKENGVPPLIHPNLTADQALRARAYLANIDTSTAA